MAITVKHKFVSAIPDAGDPTIVQPSNWNDDHDLTGTIPVANGGTGASTATGAINNLLPSQTGNTGKVLSTNGTDPSWIAAGGTGTVTSVAATAGTGISVTGSPITTSGTLNITNTAPDQTVVLTAGTGISTTGTYPNFTITNTSPSAGGDVVGPASATDNAIARFDTTTGKLIQNSVATIDDSGVLATANGLIGTNANFTDFPNAQFIASQANTGSAHIYNIGVAGEGVATDIVGAGQWGVGVYGTGATAGATRGIGVVGDGHVGNTADTAAAIGVRGYATQTHSGGQNIGLYSQATGGASNYSLFMASGNIYSAVTQTWQIPDNTANSLSIFSTGKSGILSVDTTDGAEGVSTSGSLAVSGTANLTDLAVTGTTSFDGSQGTAGQVLTSGGTGVTPTWATPSGGGGLSWQSVKTANFTAVAGEAYPVNTTSAAITVTLPASPTANQLVTVVDYAGTAATNNISISPNGNKIQGNIGTFALIINRQSVNLVYVDSTQGWVSYADQGVALTPPSITASYLLVAGGASGGTGAGSGGGGGAGGLLTGTTVLTAGTTYTIVVGAGGSAVSSTNANGNSGNNSTAFSLTAVGGGYGGAQSQNGGNGGSGGGTGDWNNGGPFTAGSATSGQGNAGGIGRSGSGGAASNNGYNAGGGGGAGAVGSAASAPQGGNGGVGASSSITSSATNYAGGGGGGTDPFRCNTASSGGDGGGGAGNYIGNATAGTANTGGGGGGVVVGFSSGAGGSGVVIISVPTANYTGTTTGSPTVTTSGSNTILKFTSSGSYTA